MANVSDRFIDMEQGTGVSNLSVWYPNQDINAETVVEKRGEDGQKTGEFETINGIPYPWTFFQRSGNSATLDNVTLVNAWGGFISLPSEMHYVVNSNMTALYKASSFTPVQTSGVSRTLTSTRNTGRIQDLTTHRLSEVKAYTRANATGFMMHRSDWEYVAGLYVSGYKTGMWIGREPGGDEAPNAQFYGLKIEDSETGIYVDNVNGFGLLFSGSEFGGDTAVYFNERFNTSVQFNGVKFAGPIVSNARGGVISFEDCTFDQYDNFALNFLGRGNALVSQSNFKQADKHVTLGANFGTFKSVNSGYNLNIESANLAAHIDNLKLDVKGGGTNTTVQVVNDVDYLFEPIPKDVKTDIDVHPRPASNAVLRLDFPRSLTGNAPTVDISAKLQEALDYIKANHGGGTIYLPGGRYRLNSPVIVPEGVELRGTWDVQHHTQGGGTAIFTAYTGGAQGENGSSLIQLKANAGLRGLTITQANITSVNLDNPNQTLKTPFLVQGQGAGVYAINLTIPIGDKGIDLASYKTDGHYVDYLGGTLLRAGIWVGGGAEGGFIRNMQFNPHYALRLPGGQGYTAPSGDLYGFVQRYSSALKFSDVEDQTIFNNFVFGSVYGIHFLKRDLGNGQFAYPGKMTMIGHGSDGCAYALYVEDADEHTKIIAINSELVNTNIATEPDRAYVKMGDTANTAKIHPDAELVLYNSAFWGSPSVAGAVVYNGNVRFQQANFTQLPGNNPGIDVQGGKAHVYSSYFQPTKNGQNNNVYAMLREGGTSIELSNNYYASGLRNSTPASNPYGIYGSDLLAEPFVFNLTKNGDKQQFSVKYNVGGRTSTPGTLKMVSPAAYAKDLTPIKVNALAAGQSVTVDLPYYVAGLVTFELQLEDGKAYTYTAKFDTAYAEKASSAGTENPAKNAATPAYVMDTKDYVTSGTWDGPQDLSAESRFAWDDSNLYAYIVVTDDVHYNSQTGGNIWREDNLQLGIDLRNPATNSTTRNELGFALTNNNQVIKWAWTRPTGANAPTAPITDIAADITRDENTKKTIYNLKIPFNTVLNNPASELANGRIGISIMLNESDGPQESDGSRTTFEVESGQLKNSSLFTDLYLLSAGKYNEMLEASARAAVTKALASESAADIAMGRNFITIMADGEVKTDLLNQIKAIDKESEISPTSAQFDLNPGKQQAAVIKLELKGNTLTAIKNGSTLLQAGTDYVVNSDQITITKAYLAKLQKGTAQLTFEFSAGQPQVLTIQVVNTTPAPGNNGGVNGGNNGGTNGGNNSGNNGGSNGGNNGGSNGGNNSGNNVGNQENQIELKDIAGHWAETAIRKAAAKGLVNGYNDHTFKPNAAVTRAEFAVMLTRASTVKGDGKQHVFKDEADIASWAKEALEQAVGAGVLSGYKDGTLRPNSGVTRAELAVMIARAFKLEDQKDKAATFTDHDKLPEWAKGAIGAVAAKGIMQGKGKDGGKFDFNAVATRAEVTTILLRVLELNEK